MKRETRFGVWLGLGVMVAGGLAGGTGCAESGPHKAAKKAHHPRGLIVLGIDGMDPDITQRLLDAGQMPNLKRMIEKGSYSPLDTSIPPQSPVAWSTVITGQHTDGHGIFDFVHRDPAHMEPYLSTARTDPTTMLPWIGVPIGGGDTHLLREGPAFWQVLEGAGIPATVFKIPANFPPAPSETAESSSGMGTPDMLGNYGTFQLFTDDPAMRDKTLQGGVLHYVDFGGGQRAKSELEGPLNPIGTDPQAMTVAVEIVRDAKRDVALIRIGDDNVVLEAGEWSDWQTVSFSPGLVGGAVSGMVRMHLRQVRPTVHLYVSPINVDPLDPAVPLSSPERYAVDLAHEVGRYYTQGMPEDTKALGTGAINRDEFLAIADTVMDETEIALDHELGRFDGGLLFVYLGTIDLTSHTFYRTMEPEATEEEKRYADAVPSLYRRVDGWLPRIEAQIPEGTEILLMSDHGFAPYHTKVHLNTFLASRGYLTVLPEGERKPGSLGHIDWSQTQAYALGLNQVFINLKGRELEGVVDPSERELVIRRLKNDLLSLRDPVRGGTAISRVDIPPVGPFGDRAPDLVIGYRRGYRSSDESALGAVGTKLFEPNRDVWSGDHCMDPTLVPGVMASSLKLDLSAGRPSLVDLATTIYGYFGVTPPEGVSGHALLAKPR